MDKTYAIPRKEGMTWGKQILRKFNGPVELWETSKGRYSVCFYIDGKEFYGTQNNELYLLKPNLGIDKAEEVFQQACTIFGMRK